jgi:hypothetical protein
MTSVGGTARLVLALCLCLAGAALAAAPPERPRLVVLTDIENEPDDTQSLVRLLLYANDIELRGLVATTSTHLRDRVHPDSIRRVIERYGQVLPRLRQHDPAYPAAPELLTLVAAGQPGYGLQAIGEGRDTPGSALLLRELLRPYPRPLWVSEAPGCGAIRDENDAKTWHRSPHASTPDVRGGVNRSRTTVPRPGALCTTNSPPSSRARSSMPSTP